MLRLLSEGKRMKTCPMRPQEENGSVVDAGVKAAWKRRSAVGTNFSFRMGTGRRESVGAKGRKGGIWAAAAHDN